MMAVEAERVVARAREAIAARGRFALALAGGSTPRSLYQLLATPRFAARIAWPGVHVFWCDERCVSPHDPESNYRMARETLLDHVPLPPANVHRILGEDEPARAAASYEELLRDFFGAQENLPSRGFDLALLGMGADGHTASLFPGNTAARETSRWVMASRGPQPESWRVTLTPVLLNAAEDVTFIVAGAHKAERLREVLEDRLSDPLPAQWVQPRSGALHWMVDAAAATRLRAGCVRLESEGRATERSRE